MDSQALDGKLEELNAALSGVTPFKLALAEVGELRLLDRNAHYMPKRTFDRLVENIARDQNLASLPFCWRQPDGRLEVLSGNHRVQAARAAGVAKVLVLYTDAELSHDERLAIQLSHNALVGFDDSTLLKELWSEIGDLTAKAYSGLDEERIAQLPQPQIVTVSDANLQFEHLHVLFLPAQVEQARQVLERVGKLTGTIFTAQVDEWNRFFELVVDVKDRCKIHSTAIALSHIFTLAQERLAQVLDERPEGDAEGAP